MFPEWVAVLSAVVLLSAPAHAFDANLSANSLPEDVAQDLRSASLVVQLTERDPTSVTAQDIVAAAQADYQRLEHGGN